MKLPAGKYNFGVHGQKYESSVSQLQFRYLAVVMPISEWVCIGPYPPPPMFVMDWNNRNYVQAIICPTSKLLVQYNLWTTNFDGKSCTGYFDVLIRESGGDVRECTMRGLGGTF